MFNLVKYRFLFLLISGLVIVPGLISLIFYQLNVGIDFTNGSEVDLRPQTQMTDAQVRDLLKPFKLESLEIVLGKGSTEYTPGFEAALSQSGRRGDRLALFESLPFFRRAPILGK